MEIDKLVNRKTNVVNYLSLYPLFPFFLLELSVSTNFICELRKAFRMKLKTFYKFGWD
jgi:hypothetical protein